MGVLKKDQVNIIVHGHNPVVSEMVLAACQSPEMIALAKAKGAQGINLAGVCCTGNELLMRHGVAMAGNHLCTELVSGHRRRGDDDRGLPVHHARHRPGGGLLSHPHGQHQRQGQVPGHDPPRVPSPQRQGDGCRPGQGGHREFRQSQDGVHSGGTGGGRGRFFGGSHRGRPGRHARRRCWRPSRPARSAARPASWAATIPRSSRTMAM